MDSDFFHLLHRTTMIRILIMATCMGMMLALIGPFGTYGDLGISERLIYWISIAVINTVQVILILIAVQQWAVHTRLRAWPPIRLAVLCTTIACCISAVPSTAEVHILEAIFRTTPPLKLVFHIEIYLRILLISIVIAAPILIAVIASSPKTLAQNPRSAQNPAHDAAQESQPHPDSSTMAHDNAPQAPAFMARLPRKYRGTVYALRSEDHYLRVYTSGGEALILMRLRDGISELERTTEGVQIHRTTWVSKAGFDGFTRSDGKVIVRIKSSNDQHIEQPVSRGCLPQLKASGWLDKPCTGVAVEAMNS